MPTRFKIFRLLQQNPAEFENASPRPRTGHTYVLEPAESNEQSDEIIYNTRVLKELPAFNSEEEAMAYLPNLRRSKSGPSTTQFVILKLYSEA